MHMFQDRHKEKWNNEMGIELETSKRHVNQSWSLSEPEQQTLAVDQLVWLYDLTFTSNSHKEALCVYLCVCVSGVGEINDLVFFRVTEGNFNKADGKVSSWNFRNTYLHSFVQFSNNPDKLPGPDGCFIQPCCVPFCMQMKCLHVKRALRGIQKEAANSA